MPDHYTYPGSEVLINLPGIRDAAETLVISVRMTELDGDSLPGEFGFGHLQAIHAHLVQDFYSWGGQLRGTDTAPGGTGIPHCRPEFIAGEASRIFAKLAELNFLRKRDQDAFSKALAWVWGETTVLHPFRDVNTRSQFVFFNQLAREAGWLIDWATIDPFFFTRHRPRSPAQLDRELAQARRRRDRGC